MTPRDKVIAPKPNDWLGHACQQQLQSSLCCLFNMQKNLKSGRRQTVCNNTVRSLSHCVYLILVGVRLFLLVFLQFTTLLRFICVTPEMFIYSSQLSEVVVVCCY